MEDTARWKEWGCLCVRAQEHVSGVQRSGPLFKWHSVCWGMCNYGGQAFDPGFPSGLNCPHIERCSVSLGTPLYSAALSCAPRWNSKHPLLKSELCPVHAPVRRGKILAMCVCRRLYSVQRVCVRNELVVNMVMLDALNFTLHVFKCVEEVCVGSHTKNSMGGGQGAVSSHRCLDQENTWHGGWARRLSW